MYPTEFTLDENLRFAFNYHVPTDLVMNYNITSLDNTFKNTLKPKTSNCKNRSP